MPAHRSGAHETIAPPARGEKKLRPVALRSLRHRDVDTLSMMEYETEEATQIAQRKRFTVILLRDFTSLEVSLT